MPSIFRTALAAAVLAGGFAATQASAAVCTGACGSLGANGDVSAPPDGSGSYGWISTFGGVNGAGQLASVGGTDGSSFATSAFTATAGQNLHYNFNFVSSDGQDAPGQFIYEDYASVQLIDVSTGNPVAMLFNARTEPAGTIVPGTGLPPISPGVTLNPASVTMSAGSGTNGAPNWSPLGDYSGQCWGPGCGLTGWIQSDYTIPADGTYALLFGVTNWGDTVYDSGLAYSGINIGGIPIGEDVPEPAAWAMLLTGLLSMGAVLRGGRRTPAAVRV